MVKKSERQGRQGMKRADREELRARRKQKMASLFLVIIMIVSIGGFALFGDSGSQLPKYNGFKFDFISVQGQDLITTTVNGKDVIFYTHPLDAININTVGGNLTPIITGAQAVILSGDPYDEIASLYDQVRFDAAQYAITPVASGVTRDHELYLTMPTITCVNATTMYPVIELNQDNVTLVNITSPSCVKISVRPEDVAYVRDRLLYSLTGIIA